MKLGGEKKGEVIALVALLVVGGFLLWRNVLAGGGGAVAPAAVVLAPAVSPVATVLPNLARLDPTLHMDKLEALRALDYSGDGRDLFHLGPAPPPPPTAAQIAAQKKAQANAAHEAALPRTPPPPPPPPPIPLKFYGFAQAAGLPERIFLQFGEDNFVVSQGDTIAHRYLIENIGKVSVRVKDLTTQSEQELPLQQG